MKKDIISREESLKRFKYGVTFHGLKYFFERESF